MWYFTWVLGTAAAILLGVVNAVWFETQQEEDGPTPSQLH